MNAWLKSIEDVLRENFPNPPDFMASPPWLWPTVWVFLAAAVCAAAAYVVYAFVIPLISSKVGAIAYTTAKEGVSQPLFAGTVVLGVAAMFLFSITPYFTFGEDVKVVKDSGLTLIMVLSIILALWTASISISEEIEGRTALTVLSKPIGRRQFVIGKYLGVLGPVVLLFIMLAVPFLCSVAYMVALDAKESSRSPPSWNECGTEVVQTLPGLVLSFFATAIMTSLSIAISTRLSMVANLLICASLYVLGNLTPLLVQSKTLGQNPIVQFVGQLFATILPNLEYFNIQAVIATGKTVPYDYVLWSGLYCLLYSTVGLIAALMMFEDRDLT